MSTRLNSIIVILFLKHKITYFLEWEEHYLLFEDLGICFRYLCLVENIWNSLFYSLLWFNYTMIMTMFYYYINLTIPSGLIRYCSDSNILRPYVFYLLYMCNTWHSLAYDPDYESFKDFQAGTSSTTISGM